MPTLQRANGWDMSMLILCSFNRMPSPQEQSERRLHLRPSLQETQIMQSTSMQHDVLCRSKRKRFKRSAFVHENLWETSRMWEPYLRTLLSSRIMLESNSKYSFMFWFKRNQPLEIIFLMHVFVYSVQFESINRFPACAGEQCCNLRWSAAHNHQSAIILAQEKRNAVTRVI